MVEVLVCKFVVDLLVKGGFMEVLVETICQLLAKTLNSKVHSFNAQVGFLLSDCGVLIEALPCYSISWIHRSIIMMLDALNRDGSISFNEEVWRSFFHHLLSPIYLFVGFS